MTVVTWFITLTIVKDFSTLGEINSDQAQESYLA